LFGGPITVDYSQISFREISVVGSFAHCWSSFDTALSLMEKRVIDVAPLVSGVEPLDQWESAFDRAERGDGAKILLSPPGSQVGAE
jgi:alcohol dehydrogenase/L-iditol 2-dehydrogenase